MKTYSTGFRNNAARFIAVLLLLTGWGLTCRPTPVTVTVGTGTSVAGYPFYTFYMCARTQMLYTAAEISAAGGAAGMISDIGFHVAIANSQEMVNFEIRLKNTSATILTGFDNTGLTTVYQSNYHVPGTGWQVIPLATPFSYSGSNLLVEICFGNNVVFSNNSHVYGTSMTGMVCHYHHDNCAGCSETTGTISPIRPNLKFIMQTGSLTYDFGDAPDPGYPTLLANNGARHLTGGLFLGSYADPEANGLPHTIALGDDLNNRKDEDGVFLTTNLIPGKTATIEVTASVAGGYLQGWIDFNRNGSWADLGERIFLNQPLAAGKQSLAFTVPASASAGSTFARFRAGSQLNLSYNGSSGSGEVEDYTYQIVPPLQTKMLNPQWPDVKTTGVDVGLSTAGGSLADDWKCTNSGKVTRIVFWGSFRADSVDPQQSITLRILSDIPVGPGIPYSRPGNQLWTKSFSAGEYSRTRYKKTDGEGFYYPPSGLWESPGDSVIWQFTFNIPENLAFDQVSGTVYWLSVVRGLNWVLPGQFIPWLGWKSSLDHWNDNAVYDDTLSMGVDWSRLLYPANHPMAGQSMDLAFLIGGEVIMDAMAGITVGRFDRLIWTPTRVLRNPDFSDAAAPVTVGGKQIADVQGIIHSSSGQGNLIWTTDSVLFHSNFSNSASLITSGGTTIQGVRGIVHCPGDFGNILWNDANVFQNSDFSLVASQVTSGGQPITGVKGAIYTPSGFGTLIWNESNLYLKNNFNLTATPVTFGGNPIDKIRGVVHSASGFGDIIWTDAELLWHADNSLVATEIKSGTSSLPGVRGVIHSPSAFGDLIWTATNLYIHNDFSTNVTNVTAGGSSIAGVLGVVHTSTAFGDLVWNGNRLFLHNDNSSTASPITVQGQLDVEVHGIMHSQTAFGDIIWGSLPGATLQAHSVFLHYDNGLTATAIVSGGNAIPGVKGCIHSSDGFEDLFWNDNNVYLHSDNLTTATPLLAGLVAVDSVFGIVHAATGFENLIMASANIYRHSNWNIAVSTVLQGTAAIKSLNPDDFDRLNAIILQRCDSGCMGGHEVSGAGINHAPAVNPVCFTGESGAAAFREPSQSSASDGRTTIVWASSGTTGFIQGSRPTSHVLSGNSMKVSGFSMRDFGDCPDPPYPTADLSYGASHAPGNLFLGSKIDYEDGAFPNANATGDDLNNQGDEEGIRLPGGMLPGANISLSVTVSGTGGFLQGWIDYNGNGSWSDAGEQVVVNQQILSNPQNVTFTVPFGITMGDKYARFRYSSAPGLGFSGWAADGEAEDYTVHVGYFGDFGDAPEGSIAYPVAPGFPVLVFGAFPTCMNVTTSGFMCHQYADPAGNKIYFGNTCDAETEGNEGSCPTFAPNLYDQDECQNDGDAGLIRPTAFTLVSGNRVQCSPGTIIPLGEPNQRISWGPSANIDISVRNGSTSTAYVNLVIDWDRSGSWNGIAEYVLQNFAIPAGYNGPLSLLNPPRFTIGPDSLLVWARFTISPTVIFPGFQGWDGSGSFDAGETEDYLLYIQGEHAGPPDFLTLENLTIQGPSPVCYEAARTITVAGSGTTFTVANGGNATLVSGEKIFMLTGTTVQSGGYLRAYITGTGQYCGTQKSAEDRISGESGHPGLSGNHTFLIYPNPTSGKFTLGVPGEMAMTKISVEISTLIGVKVKSMSLYGSSRYAFTLGDQQPGVYLIHILTPTGQETQKIIRY